MDKIRIEFPLKGKDIKVTEQDSVNYMMIALNKLIGFGALKGPIDKFLLDYEFNKDRNYCTAIIDKAALKDPSKFQSIGASLSYPVELDELKVDENKSFSAATIQERLRLDSLPPKSKFRSTVLDYKKYWESNKRKLAKDSHKINILKNLFISDLNHMFTEILPFVQEGKQLSTLTGLQSVTEGMNKISRELSLAYARALKQANASQLSPRAFKELQVKYNEFMNSLIPQVFNGIGDYMNQTVSFSKTEVDSIYLCGSLGTLQDILSDIHSKLQSGNNVKIKVDDEDYELTPENVKIDTFSKSSHESQTSGYHTMEDGRIKLFD